ncbi:MAG: hypothetical protein IPK97_20230 [Ahniella sp.]|nr:hypothetical protein [Ahniella sp.]
MQRNSWVVLIVLAATLGLSGWLVSDDRIGVNRSSVTGGDSGSAPAETIAAEDAGNGNTTSANETRVVTEADVLDVFHAADAVRFAPDAWPPLPADDQPVREALDDMLARAEQGDASAACWLGVKLRHCGSELSSSRRLTAVLEESVRTAKTPADQVAALGTQSEYLDSLVICQGLKPEWVQRGLDFTRQAALAGSRLAIGEIVRLDGYLEPGFPDAQVIRRTLDEREAFIWAGVKTGIPQAIHQLTFDAQPFAMYNVQSPKVPGLSREDLLATQYLLHEMITAMVKKHPVILLDPEVVQGMKEGLSIRSQLTESRRIRIENVVRQIDVEAWPTSDTPGESDEPDNPFKTAQRSCRDFGEPVNLKVSIKDVVSP